MYSGIKMKQLDESDYNCSEPTLIAMQIKTNEKKNCFCSIKFDNSINECNCRRFGIDTLLY